MRLWPSWRVDSTEWRRGLLSVLADRAICPKLAALQLTYPSYPPPSAELASLLAEILDARGSGLDCLEVGWGKDGPETVQVMRNALQTQLGAVVRQIIVVSDASIF